MRVNKKLSVFKKNKLIELCFLQGFFGALLFFIGTSGEVNFFHAFLACILMSVIVHTFFYFCYGKNHLMEIQSQQEAFFEGNIEELIKELYSSGLRLRSQIGRFYIFRVNYILFPKDDIVVYETKKGCCLQSKAILIEYLSKVVCLKSSPGKDEIECNKSNNGGYRNEEYK